jgi:hypothetical protein
MELSKSIQTFYKTVMESSSDEDSNDDTELMMVARMLLHEHTSRLVYRARSGDARPMSSATVRRAITNSIVTTSILPTQSLTHKDSSATTNVKEVVPDEYEQTEGAHVGDRATKKNSSA